MPTVSKLFCTGSRSTLANRCLSILFCDRFPKDVMFAASSAGTCGRVGDSVSSQPLAPCSACGVRRRTQQRKIRTPFAVCHGVLPVVPSARQSHLQLGPV